MCIRDSGNLQRGEKDRADDFGLLLDSFLTSGTLFGELCDYYATMDDLAASLRGRAVISVSYTHLDVYKRQARRLLFEKRGGGQRAGVEMLLADIQSHALQLLLLSLIHI